MTQVAQGKMKTCMETRELGQGSGLGKSAHLADKQACLVFAPEPKRVV